MVFSTVKKLFQGPVVRKMDSAIEPDSDFFQEPQKGIKNNDTAKWNL